MWIGNTFISGGFSILMFIQDCFIQIINEIRNSNSRADFIRYCTDLQKISGGYLDNNQLEKRSGYAFSELIDRIASRDEKINTWLREIDQIIIVHDIYECNPKYVHIGAYLMDHWNKNADYNDITDQGGLSFVTALHIFNQKKYSHGLILGFDQTIAPIRKEKNDNAPEHDGVGFLKLHHAYGLFKVLDAFFVPFFSDFEKLEGVFDYCFFLTQDQSYLKKEYRIKNKIPFIQIINSGVLPLFSFFSRLESISKSHIKKSTYLIIIEESKINAFGVIFLEKSGD